MDYSNLFSSGLRVMAYCERDSTEPLPNTSPPPTAMVSIHPLALESRSTERNHTRIKSLPARLFKRTVSTRSTPNSPRAGSSGWSSWSMPPSRRSSVEHGRVSGSRHAPMDVSLEKDVESEERAWEIKSHTKPLAEMVSLHTPPPTPYSSSSARAPPPPPQRPLPPLPPSSPSPTPSRSDSTPSPPPPRLPPPRSGASFLFLSSSSSSSTNLLQLHPRSRPTSVSASIPSHRSSRQYRDDVSVITSDEVEDWRRFYVALIPVSDDLS